MVLVKFYELLLPIEWRQREREKVLSIHELIANNVIIPS